MQHLRDISGRNRTSITNERLGSFLAFVAGAVNAGGFLAVQQYTSHMTGIVSAMADDIILGNFVTVLAGLAALISFLSGAALSAMMISWGKRHGLHSVYASSLMLEAILLLCFGFIGANLANKVAFHVSLTVMLLSLIMGIQNAIITKISNSTIRTTHVTGIVTDIGIELGKLIYWNQDTEQPESQSIRCNKEKLRLLLTLLLMFFFGGVIGALGFKSIGFSATIPIACALIIAALVPIMDDISQTLNT